MKIIKNANLITMSEKYGNIENGYVKIQDHKIIEVGKMSDFSDSNIDAEIIEAEGRITTPGLVDAHSHLGMWEDGLDFEGDDGNEDTDPCYSSAPGDRRYKFQWRRSFREAFASRYNDCYNRPGKR